MKECSNTRKNDHKTGQHVVQFLLNISRNIDIDLKTIEDLVFHLPFGTTENESIRGSYSELTTNENQASFFKLNLLYFRLES